VVPGPASTITGTDRGCMMVRMAGGFSNPRPGEARTC
jgi:hypothetical protein